MLLLFNWEYFLKNMNKRFIAVGILLGIAVGFAVVMGAPMFGGYDIAR